MTSRTPEMRRSCFPIGEI
ncbi:MAG: hypothetical protein EVA89_28880 [Sandaracinaceae bacterium]|nr:MAG: hypothetical protein EVA89_28880 [Sandaracinaceae bacterium]